MILSRQLLSVFVIFGCLFFSISFKIIRPLGRSSWQPPHWDEAVHLTILSVFSRCLLMKNSITFAEIKLSNAAENESQLETPRNVKQ